MTILKTSEILIKAKCLIDEPVKWMQGDYTDGENCFCALGALAAVVGIEIESAGDYSGDKRTVNAAKTLKEVVASSDRFQTPNENFAAYNDRSTHQEVMEAFDKAILLSLQRGD